MGNAGTTHGALRRSLAAGMFANACAAAHDLPHVPLDAALDLTLLAARKKPERFEEMAVRWLGRFTEERAPSLTEHALVATLLRAAGEGSGEAAAELRAIVAG